MQPWGLQRGMELTLPILEGFFFPCAAATDKTFVRAWLELAGITQPTKFRWVSARWAANANCFTRNEGREELFSYKGVHSRLLWTMGRWPNTSINYLVTWNFPRDCRELYLFIFYFYFFKFYFIFKLYNIVLVLPNIEMNPPQVYARSPSWTLLPPLPSLWVVPVHQPPASRIVHRAWTGDSFHTWYYTCFNAILPNLPTLSLSHRVHKTDLYIGVTVAVSYTGLLLPSF